MPINALPRLRAYIGLGKQAAQGTAVAPTVYIPWLDGSNANPERRMQFVPEGDGLRDPHYAYAQQQMYKGKIICYPRPALAQTLLTWSLGHLSETATNGTTPTGTNTLAAASAANATTVSATATQAVNDIIQIGTSPTDPNPEVRTVTAVSGVGPYSLTVAALNYAHAIGATVKIVTSPYAHTISVQATSDWYTVEFGFLDSSLVYRVQDCLVNQLLINQVFGQLIRFELDFFGISATSQASAATPTIEAAAPFLYAGGTFNVDSSLTGLALAVKQIQITLRNMVDDTIFTESFTPAGLIFTRREVAAQYTAVWQDKTEFAKIFWNAGTTDSAVVGTGALDITYGQPAGSVTASLELQTPNLNYTGNPVQPALDGRALEQVFAAQSIYGTNPTFTAIVKNSQLLQD